jgi:hypothetical protein
MHDVYTEGISKASVTIQESPFLSFAPCIIVPTARGMPQPHHDSVYKNDISIALPSESEP